VSVPLAPAPATGPNPTLRRTLYLVGIAVWATGVLYWIFDKYMLRHSDIGLSENPLQVWWLRLHAATATAIVWLFGYMCAIHVQRNWQAAVRRSSGTMFLSLLTLLTLTGYLIYYVEADRPLALLSQLHWIVGLCAPLAFLAHRGLRRRVGATGAATTLLRSSALRPQAQRPTPVKPPQAVTGAVAATVGPVTPQSGAGRRA
jgi:hypothetical protein